MGPIWGRQDPDGPHAGPMNITISVIYGDLDSLYSNPELATYCSTILVINIHVDDIDIVRVSLSEK